MNDALVAALLEIERHVSRAGWDQPARLFALVRTTDLLAAEPALAEQLVLPPGRSEDALSSVEQEDFHAGEALLEALAGIAWPPTVFGCAVAVERSFLPADAEGDLPADLEEAARVVAEHPRRQDVRVVVGVLRDGSRHGLARLVSNPEDLLGGEDLVPGLTTALTATLD